MRLIRAGSVDDEGSRLSNAPVQEQLAALALHSY